MTTTARRLVPLCAVVAALAGLAVAGGGAAANPVAHASGGSVDFGEIFDFTGVGSGPSPYANASQLSAIYDINAAGGVLGEHVNNVVVDTKSDPADGVLALNRALAVNHSSAEVGPSTLQAAALVPILARTHIITCVRAAIPSSTAPPTSTSGGSSRPIPSAARRWRSMPSSSAIRAWPRCSAPTPGHRATCRGSSTGSRRRS